ncbi:bifunctional glutamate N-acetyltransferase/amino-acid acetyltransferase ArgJ [Methylotetracoccus oryzae]|uniref:bifunctional glutamate N-acetyltransferase/amino-acid acetyltransferase ArgJ n=1 Tax=Methylotetracoccus oryzae TaxID=1919059 RepID=UPI001117BF1C|nr:bifunctional glutamate N-acetyltransferase/amino-acid acetyltransferase ArgJ [Methylotetracoccus oryzae]
MTELAFAPVPGVRLGTAAAGIKRSDRDDVLLMEVAPGGSVAAVFTRNAFCAAPVRVAREHLTHAPRWLLVNSGNANAGTGERGMADALRSCEAVAALTGGAGVQVLPFSTGVIGEYLPVDRIEAALPFALASLDENAWGRAARAIMTTDTRPKLVSRSVEVSGRRLTITGIAKGAGMIHPNMATMLSFIATDARIAQPVLQACLERVADDTFNCITVDGDTSTNDACVLVASGVSSGSELAVGSPDLQRFEAALAAVCGDLAEAIVRDGEGATKLMRIRVEEAASAAEARAVGLTIAHSPLVKTAFFASDPNWGRILAAVGRAGVNELDIDRVGVWLNDMAIVSAGARSPDYTEEAGQAVMQQSEITVRVALGRGQAVQTVLTCDLSYDYVRINADYRT